MHLRPLPYPTYKTTRFGNRDHPGEKVSREDVVQAIVAALLFGEGARLAAGGTEEGALCVGGGCTVRISDDAKNLLREAQAVAEVVKPRSAYGTYHYDLKK